MAQMGRSNLAVLRARRRAIDPIVRSDRIHRHQLDRRPLGEGLRKAEQRGSELVGRLHSGDLDPAEALHHLGLHVARSLHPLFNQPNPSVGRSKRNCPVH